MKKYFLLVCIAFISVSIQAQWSLGGKAGINWSTINYPWSKLGDHADYLSGFQGGIIATYQFNNYFDMQAELFYSARGYTDDEFYLTDESGAVISNTYTCRTHYLDIPVLVKFFPCNGLNVQFGPQLGIGLSLSDKWKGINNDDYSIYRDSAVDFSLAFGLGYEFNFGVFVDARYTLGLTKTIREVVKGFQGRNISLAVGYRVYL